MIGPNTRGLSEALQGYTSLYLDEDGHWVDLIREMPAPDPDRIPSGTVWRAEVRYAPYVYVAAPLEGTGMTDNQKKALEILKRIQVAAAVGNTTFDDALFEESCARLNAGIEELIEFLAPQKGLVPSLGVE